MKYIVYFTMLFSGFLVAQINYNEEFASALQSNDSITQEKILNKWNLQNPQDADLQNAYLSYYFLKSVRETRIMSYEQLKTDSKPLKDSLGNTVGYITNVLDINETEFQKGIDKINKGIGLHPNRLDLRLKKAHVYSETEKWNELTETLVEVVKYSYTINNNWTWINDVELNDSGKTMYENIQKYQKMLYNTNIDEQLYNMRLIAKEILLNNPNHTESLNNLAITHLVLNENERGLEYLLKLEKINPIDIIMLNNIAQAYISLKNNAKAIEYFEKIIATGSSTEKEEALKNITDLQK